MSCLHLAQTEESILKSISEETLLHVVKQLRAEHRRKRLLDKTKDDFDALLNDILEIQNSMPVQPENDETPKKSRKTTMILPSERYYSDLPNQRTKLIGKLQRVGDQIIELLRERGVSNLNHRDEESDFNTNRRKLIGRLQRVGDQEQAKGTGYENHRKKIGRLQRVGDQLDELLRNTKRVLSHDQQNDSGIVNRRKKLGQLQRVGDELDELFRDVKYTTKQRQQEDSDQIPSRSKIIGKLGRVGDTLRAKEDSTSHKQLMDSPGRKNLGRLQRVGDELDNVIRALKRETKTEQQSST